MTIGGWIVVAFGWLFILAIAIGVIIFAHDDEKTWLIVLTVIIAIVLCVGIYHTGIWYFTSTASGIRAMTDQEANLSNGLERTITVYTANGEKIAEYEGKIDIEMDQNYVKFDWNGRRYIYYNCFIETIASIP